MALLAQLLWPPGHENRRFSRHWGVRWGVLPRAGSFSGGAERLFKARRRMMRDRVALRRRTAPDPWKPAAPGGFLKARAAVLDIRDEAGDAGVGPRR